DPHRREALACEHLHNCFRQKAAYAKHYRDAAWAPKRPPRGSRPIAPSYRNVTYRPSCKQQQQQQQSNSKSGASAATAADSHSSNSNSSRHGNSRSKPATLRHHEATIKRRQHRPIQNFSTVSYCTPSADSHRTDRGGQRQT
ncbi:unnamed protein product, partial [Trichogramma brassicae]